MNNIDLQSQIKAVVSSLDREFKSPVSVAFANCDGSFSDFSSELRSQLWENPDLPVDDILSRIGDFV
jgi:hypothetical protein